MESDSTPLSIEAVAARTGLSAHTLRYYERIGLIPPVARAAGGQRRYSAADLAWIEFLLRLRATRMPIGRMLDFARLRGAGNVTAGERRQMLEAHLEAVVAEIEAMQEASVVLRDKIAFYRGLERSFSPDPTAAEGENHVQRPLRQRSRQTR